MLETYAKHIISNESDIVESRSSIKQFALDHFDKLNKSEEDLLAHVYKECGWLCSSDWKKEVAQIPLNQTQENDHDCGIFICEYARIIFERAEKTDIQALTDAPAIRGRCIQSRSDAFRDLVEEIAKERVIKSNSEIVEL
jgi:hypothetical protein